MTNSPTEENPSKIIQLHSSHSEEFAAYFEELAAEVRAGNIVGFSGVVIRPGGKFTTTGWTAKETNIFEEVGMNFFNIMSIYKNSLKPEE